MLLPPPLDFSNDFSPDLSPLPDPSVVLSLFVVDEDFFGVLLDDVDNLRDLWELDLLIFELPVIFEEEDEARGCIGDPIIACC